MNLTGKALLSPSVIRKPALGVLAATGMLTLILLVCYAPALLTHYGFSDDYTLLAEGMDGGTSQQWFALACGRPIYSAFLYAAFHSVSHIDQLGYVRLFGILAIGWLAGQFYRALVVRGWNEYQSLSLAVILTTMPVFQLYAAWATLSLHVPGALLACAACSVAERGYEAPPSRRRGWLAGWAAFLVLASSTLHQSAAMFFWVFTAITVFRPDATPREARRQLVWHGAICLVGLAAAFGVFRLGTAIVGRLSLDRAELTIDPWAKLWWFVSEPLVNALNMALLFPRRRYALLAWVLLAIGLTRYFRGSWTDRIRLGLLAALLMPLSYLPNLLTAESWATYRTTCALTSLVVVYAFFAVQGYGSLLRTRLAARILNSGYCGAALVCMALAIYQVQAFVTQPQGQELALLRQQLARADFTHAKQVILLCPPEPPFEARRYDEFGNLSSLADWSARPMVSLLLRELDPRRADLPVRSYPATTPFECPPANAVVLDLREMVNHQRGGASDHSLLSELESPGSNPWASPSPR